MDVESVQIFTALLSIAALGGALIALVARLLAARSSLAAQVSHSVSLLGWWLAFAVAAVATVGSLYFSDVAGYIPCRLCWFQRIAMYPLTVITLVAAVRRDRHAIWYVVPVAGIGALIAAYHYLLEWRPELEGGVCTVTGPACSDLWFREFNFVTLAFMALAGFVAIIIFSLLAASPGDSPTDADHPDADRAFGGDEVQTEHHIGTPSVSRSETS